MEYLIIWALFGVATAIVASGRGESAGLWFFLGVLLGPLGLLLSFRTGRQCSACQSRIHRKAKVCPRCHQPQGEGGESVEPLYEEAKGAGLGAVKRSPTSDFPFVLVIVGGFLLFWFLLR